MQSGLLEKSWTPQSARVQQEVRSPPQCLALVNLQQIATAAAALNINHFFHRIILKSSLH